MKFQKLFMFLPIAAALTLSSCVDPSAINYNPSAYSPGSQYSGANQNDYNRGYDAGRRDAQRGLRMNYANHRSEFNGNSENQFKHGYQVAYRNYTPHYTTSYNNNSYSPTYSNQDYNAKKTQGHGSLRAEKVQNGVRITQGGKKISFLRTASPNVEKYHFLHNKSQMVIKSRGNHGPATVELFDTRTGVLKGKVLAYAIKHGQPSWARGMQD